MDPIELVTHRSRPVPADRLRRLYDHVGWWPERSAAEIAAVLDGAVAVGAWHGEDLVGFARLVTDGRFRAYVEDVAVHESCRRRGLGTAIVRELLAAAADIDLTTLFCEPGLVPLYEGLGFRATSQVVLHRA